MGDSNNPVVGGVAPPESWESQADPPSTVEAATDAATVKFSTLNVNAVEFVPSFAMPGTATPHNNNDKNNSNNDDDNNDMKQAPSSGQLSSTATISSPDPPIVFNGVEQSHECIDEKPPPPPPPPSSSSSESPPPTLSTPTEVTVPPHPPPPPITTTTMSSAATSTTATTAFSGDGSSPDEEGGGGGGTWEDVAEEDDDSASIAENRQATTTTTPPTEQDDEDVSTEDTLSKLSAKKKTIKVEAPKVKKEHVNVVFIGHVDAGKSTIGGQIMALTGMVDKRTLEKYEREAREKSRESWYLSWALDTNQEERDKGKTVEVGRAFFETEKKHFTILDAPGHKSFVPNMIGGAAQADLAVLVISARKGEFETGFDRGGQTREHAMLVKTVGVKYLVVLVNKMDDPTVNWDEVRYNECRDKILPFLKKLGFTNQRDLFFLPCSGQTGQGLREPLDEQLCPWYSGPAFIPFIDELPSLVRKCDGPFIMPIVDKYKDMGTVVMGKVESGICLKGQSLVIMPNRTPVTVDQLWSDDDEVGQVVSGENVKIKVKGVEEEDVSPGFVLCDAAKPIQTGRTFDAQLLILEHKSIICAGYSAVMHIHCAAEEVTVKALICLVDKKTNEKSRNRPRFVKQDQAAIMRIECTGAICLEPFKLFPQMGRFTLRDENKTIAIGKVLKIVD